MASINQSVYRACLSTETAFLKIHSDIATMDKGTRVGLVLLDLSAAKDTSFSPP